MSNSKKNRQASGPAKTSKAKTKAAPSAAAEKKNEVLQAVLLTESFQDRFRPFSIEKPRCLLPLANVPLIEYTLEFLAMNGVQELFIYSGIHTAQIEAYVNTSRWAPSCFSSPFTTVKFLPLLGATSLGDVLRDLDKRELIETDFVLVHGDVVSNISLDPALDAHRKRREAPNDIKNGEAIMTMVLREAGCEPHRTRPNGGITPVFVVDTETSRCLHYDEIHSRTSEKKMLLDPEIVGRMSTSFEIRADLIDPGIDICTPQVLALWSDTFDYELPRRHFLYGVLQDFELNGKSIYTHIVEQGYAARAHNLPMYEAISQDVLGRWTFPFVPDCNLLPGQTYQEEDRNMYLEENVALARNCETSNTIIGHGTLVGKGSKVFNSTIGRGCTIGASVEIYDSYVWDGTVIQDGTKITRSIVAESVTIGKNCSIGAGSLISFNVHIGNDITIADSTAVTTVTLDNQLVKQRDVKQLGTGTNAAIFTDPDIKELGEEDPSALERTLIYVNPKHSFSSSSISTLASSVADSDDFGGLSIPGAGPRPRLYSFLSDDGSSAPKNTFHTDSVSGLLDALRNETTSEDFESTRVEFVALRMAKNASDASIRRSIATAFIRRAVELMGPDHGSLEPSRAAERALTSRRGAPKFIEDMGVDDGGVDGQVSLILALQAAMLGLKDIEPARSGTLLAALMQQLYNLDVLEEDGILAWWSDDRSTISDGLSALRLKCKALVEWLENASEEEDDDDDDDDEDDE